MPVEPTPDDNAEKRFAAGASPAALAAPIAVMIAVLAVYAVWFARTEQALYHADQVAYWSYSRSLADLARHDPIGAVRSVIRSVAEDDVNLLPAVPISAVMLIFGGSRMVYLLAVILVYGSATAAALVFALRRIGARPPPWAAPLAFALLATVWQPVFIGYLGLGGVALALVVLGLVVPDLTAPPRTRTLLIAGCVLGILVLFRRWWGIWGVALLIVLLVDAARRYLRSDDRGLKGLKRSFRTFVLVSLGSGLTVIALAAPVLVHKLRTDYADRFSAYTHESLAGRWASVVDHFGLLGLLAVVAGGVLLLTAAKTRGPGAFLLAHLATTFVVMTRIQDHTPQHWWLYSAQALLVVGWAAAELSARLPDRKAMWSVLVSAVSGVFLTVSVFVSGGPVNRATLGPLVPSDVIRPTIRHDLDEIDRMLTYLDRGIGSSEAKLYVLSSSPTLSDHVLAFSNMSLNAAHRSPAAILQATHVDRWHGFPRGLLTADVVLVADPVQLHLRPEFQRVVAEPAESFLEGTDIALAFDRLPEVFELDGGVVVRIFLRVRPNTPGEISALSDRLRRFYPDRPDIYSPE
ncbi:MAG: hypothetical protein V2I67_03610 [Thermoanaerobaculales bacterium]|jgi:hypothetical protein|nr:hypothetical protein [Thermoanaerobaculales bacterium]